MKYYAALCLWCIGEVGANPPSLTLLHSALGCRCTVQVERCSAGVEVHHRLPNTEKVWLRRWGGGGEEVCGFNPSFLQGSSSIIVGNSPEITENIKSWKKKTCCGTNHIIWANFTWQYEITLLKHWWKNNLHSTLGNPCSVSKTINKLL